MNSINRYIFWMFIVLGMIGRAGADTIERNRDMTKTVQSNGYTEIRLQSGQNYETPDGEYAPRNQALVETGDPVWPIGIQASDWQLYAATDSLQFRAETPDGDGIEYAISDIGLHWFDDATGTDTYVSLGWDLNAGESIITGNVLNRDLAAGLEYVAIAGVNGLKVNTIWSAPAIAAIPAPTQVIAATAAAEDVYVSMILDVYDWTGLGVFADDSYVAQGAIWTGTAIEFRSMVGTELSFEQTMAYRNPGFISPLGDSFYDWDSYSEVLYTVDRLNNRIYIDAPYQLFIGAQTVIVDPPVTWTSGRTSSDIVNTAYENTATTNYGSQGFAIVGHGSGTYDRAGYLKFANFPASHDVDDASATLILKYHSQADTSTRGIVIGRSLRPFAEMTSNWNVYDTGLSWGTAGGKNSTTDYNGAGALSYSWVQATNITVSNDATLNAIIENMINGTNNGLIIVSSGAGTNDYKAFYTDDDATASNRPYLSITYTGPFTLPVLPEDSYMSVESGSIAAYFTIPSATTNYVTVANIAVDVTMEILLDDGTFLVYGQGAEADYNYDSLAAVDLIGGGSMFVVANTSYTLYKAAGCSLYYKSSLTGIEETRFYGLSPSGGSTDISGLEAGQTSILAAIDSNPVIAGNTMLVSDSVGSDQIRLSFPASLDLEPGQYVELLALGDTADATPAIWVNLRNNQNDSVANWHYEDGGTGWAALAYTYADVDNNDLYGFRLRYQITPADISSVTGPAQLIVSASTPVGVRSLSVPLKLNETLAKSQETDFADVIASNAALEATVKARTLGNGYQIYAAPGYAIAGNTYGATFDVGYQNVPEGEVVCTLNTEPDETTGAETVTNIIFYDYIEVEPGVYIPQHLRKEYGALSYYSNGIIKSCTEIQALEWTGWGAEAFVGRTPTDTYGE